MTGLESKIDLQGRAAIQRDAAGHSTATLYRSMTPFVVADLAVLALLTAFLAL